MYVAFISILAMDGCSVHPEKQILNTLGANEIASHMTVLVCISDESAWMRLAHDCSHYDYD